MESEKTGRYPILVVDDHQVNQQLAVLLIERLGYRTDVAANGQEAVKACSTNPYSLVFMDCHMPVMDGYDATKKIREMESVKREAKEKDSPDPLPLTPDGTLHVPIIAMTANALPGDREKCLQAGMDDYLPKPIRPDGLAQILEKWLPANCTK